MKKNGILVALATGVLLGAATIAPAQRIGVGFGRGWGYGRGGGFPRSYSGFGLGLGLGGWGAPRTTVVYRNAFTGDVEYAERAVNDFRRAYEGRKGDPLRIKAEVQRMDQAMERLRGEAERYGGVTDRGTDLMRNALDRSDRIDRRFRETNDTMDRRWVDVRRIVDRLAQNYRLD